MWCVQWRWKPLPLCMPRWQRRCSAVIFSRKLTEQSLCNYICMGCVCLCVDQNIRLYDTSRGRFHLKRTVKARDVGWSVLDVCFTPDSRSVLYSSWSDYSKTHTCTCWPHNQTGRKMYTHTYRQTLLRSKDRHATSRQTHSVKQTLRETHLRWKDRHAKIFPPLFTKFWIAITDYCRAPSN